MNLILLNKRLVCKVSSCTQIPENVSFNKPCVHCKVLIPHEWQVFVTRTMSVVETLDLGSNTRTGSRYLQPVIDPEGYAMQAPHATHTCRTGMVMSL